MTTRVDKLVCEIESACPHDNRNTVVGMLSWCFEEAVRRLVEFECNAHPLAKRVVEEIAHHEWIDAGFDDDRDDDADSEPIEFRVDETYIIETDVDGMTHRWSGVHGKIMMEISKLADPGNLTVEDLTQILGPTADVRKKE